MSLTADQPLPHSSLPQSLQIFSGGIWPQAGQFDLHQTSLDPSSTSWMSALSRPMDDQVVGAAAELVEWTERARLGLVGIRPDLAAIDARRGANMTERVPVPSSEHVAEIVGRQGCKIKALRSKTNTYIKTPARGEESVFVVTGRQEDVSAAKLEIISAADHFSQIRASRRQQKNSSSSSSSASSTSGISSGSPSGEVINDVTIAKPESHSGRERDDQQVTIGVRVPDNVVGLVVGPKGATIKRIQQETDTYIVTPGRDKDPVFEVIGLRRNAEAAKREIESYIENRIGFGTSPGSGDSVRGFDDSGISPPYGSTGTEAWVESVGVWTGVPDVIQPKNAQESYQSATEAGFDLQDRSSQGFEVSHFNAHNDLRNSWPNGSDKYQKMVDSQYQEWAASTLPTTNEGRLNPANCSGGLLHPPLESNYWENCLTAMIEQAKRNSAANNNLMWDVGGIFGNVSTNATKSDSLYWYPDGTPLTQNIAEYAYPESGFKGSGESNTCNGLLSDCGNGSRMWASSFAPAATNSSITGTNSNNVIPQSQLASHLLKGAAESGETNRNGVQSFINNKNSDIYCNVSKGFNYNQSQAIENGSFKSDGTGGCNTMNNTQDKNGLASQGTDSLASLIQNTLKMSSPGVMGSISQSTSLSYSTGISSSSDTSINQINQ